MIEVTIEQIQEKFASLPEELRWAIMGADVDEKLVAIGKLNNLNIEQMGQLSLETHAVMLGFVHPDQFEDSISKSMHLSKDRTKVLVNEINEKILKNIKNQVLALHHTKNNSNINIIKEAVEEERKNITKNINNTDAIALNNENKTEKEEKEIKTQTSILSAKLSGPFKINGAKTEHTVEGISKQDDSKNKTIDPYRMPIE